MAPRSYLYLRWVFRLVLLVAVVSGWFGAGWLGAVIGIFAGFIAACAAWCIGYYIALGWFFRGRQREMSLKTSDQLREITLDPASPDLAFAISELERRGIVALPSLESILDLLQLPDSNQRGLAIGLLGAFYPTICARLAKGSSNLDTPDAWCDRLRAMNRAGLLSPAGNEIAGFEQPSDNGSGVL